MTWVVFAMLLPLCATFGFHSYSACLIFNQSDGFVGSGVVSLSPDPQTGDAQPRIALNVTALGATVSHWAIGGIRSVVGGVATLPSIYYSAGDLRLEAFDFTSAGWMSVAQTSVDSTGTITFSANCSRLFWCPWITRATLDATTDGTLSMLVDASGQPRVLRVSSAAGMLSVTFDRFAANAQTYQRDDSVYQLPAAYFAGARARRPVAGQWITVIRSMANDSFARRLANDDVADAAGEAYHACSSPARPLAIFAEFKVLIDTANFADYTPCKRGFCACSTTSAAECQCVGIATAHGTWLSLPVSAMCPINFALGTNNCTWSAGYKLIRAVTAQCVLSIPDPLFPSGFRFSNCTGNIVNVGKHIQFAIDNCADIKHSLEGGAR